MDRLFIRWGRGHGRHSNRALGANDVLVTRTLARRIPAADRAIYKARSRQSDAVQHDGDVLADSVAAEWAVESPACDAVERGGRCGASGAAAGGRGVTGTRDRAGSAGAASTEWSPALSTAATSTRTPSSAG